MEDDDGRWLSIGQASRMLGIGRAAIYGRIKRGSIEARRSNDGAAWEVLVDRDTLAASHALIADREHDTSRDDHMATLRVELTIAQERLAAVERELDDKAKRLTSTEAELAEVRRELIAELRRSFWKRLFTLR